MFDARSQVINRSRFPGPEGYPNSVNSLKPGNKSSPGSCCSSFCWRVWRSAYGKNSLVANLERCARWDGDSLRSGRGLRHINLFDVECKAVAERAMMFASGYKTVVFAGLVAGFDRILFYWKTTRQVPAVGIECSHFMEQIDTTVYEQQGKYKCAFTPRHSITIPLSTLIIRLYWRPVQLQKGECDFSE